MGSEKLAGKVALITGGDSGIGRAVAVLFAREGADISIVYLNEHDDGTETCRAVGNKGRRCMLVSGDVRDPQFCAGLPRSRSVNDHARTAAFSESVPAAPVVT
jgi:NAD(P)-dependent dehydrogenase (short-subunit alcohol dehydrogenase family)